MLQQHAHDVEMIQADRSMQCGGVFPEARRLMDAVMRVAITAGVRILGIDIGTVLQQQLDHFVLVFRWQDGSMERRQVLPEQR